MMHPEVGLAPHRPIGPIALVIGIVGTAISILGFVIDAPHAYGAYLTAYATVLSTALGALILVMMSHASGAKWFVVLRRLTENAAATLPALVVLFVPILFGLHDLYPWVPPLDRLPAPERALIRAKSPYLNVPFFIVRFVVYFIVWVVIAQLLRRWSVRQDDEGGLELTRWQRRLSAGGLPAVALTLTFASFDWMMSLSPTWYSTVYGVYVFAGGFVAALALVAVIAVVEQRAGRLSDPVLNAHLHALGKLLLTFVIFWAYIAFAQILIIWIGGIPIEIAWYAARLRGGWGALGLALALGQFVVPFLVLLSRDFKERPLPMAALGVWLLAMHYVDMYWLLLPSLRPHGFASSWWDLPALAAVTGLTVAYGAWRARTSDPVPIGDPYFNTSLGYRSAT